MFFVHQRACLAGKVFTSGVKDRGGKQNFLFQLQCAVKIVRNLILSVMRIAKK